MVDALGRVRQVDMRGIREPRFSFNANIVIRAPLGLYNIRYISHAPEPAICVGQARVYRNIAVEFYQLKY